MGNIKNDLFKEQLEPFCYQKNLYFKTVSRLLLKMGRYRYEKIHLFKTIKK